MMAARIVAGSVIPFRRCRMNFTVTQGQAILKLVADRKCQNNFPRCFQFFAFFPLPGTIEIGLLGNQ